MESMWNLCGIHISEYMIYVVKHIPCGIHAESMDSTWNKSVPHGFHVECGGMVKYCITVVFHSIRQGLWCVTAQPKFWFQHSQNLAMTRPEIWQYSATGHKIILFWDSDHQTVSALEKIACYHHYILAILKATWCITAELNEILQYLITTRLHLKSSSVGQLLCISYLGKRIADNKDGCSWTWPEFRISALVHLIGKKHPAE